MAKRRRRAQRRAEARERSRIDRPAQSDSAAPTDVSRGFNVPKFDRRKLQRVVVGLFAAAAIGGALLIGLSGGNGVSAAGITDLPDYLNQQSLSVAARQGALAPDFELQTLDGSRFRLSDWRGHPILLNFWASWCGPCRQEMPALVQLQAQHIDDGLLVVGVNMSESSGDAQSFADELQLNFPVPMDFSGNVTDRYLQIGPPNSYFINPDGTIRELIIGGGAFPELSAQVDRILAELDAPVGSLMLTGLKAVPTALIPAAATVATTVGSIAPDFLLRLENGQNPLWRLIDQRGVPLVLLFQPPSCRDCDDVTSAAATAAVSRGYQPVVVAQPSTDEAAAAPGADAGAALLDWDQTVADIFAAGSAQRFVVIGADGVVQAVANAGQDLGAVLAALGPLVPDAG